jgi:hypothetical protein
VGRRNDYGHDGIEGGAVMSQGSIVAGNTRRRAFFIWAAILSLVFGLLFIGVTALTIGLWLAHQNALTTWGVLFLVAAEWEARQGKPPAGQGQGAKRPDSSGRQ